MFQTVVFGPPGVEKEDLLCTLLVMLTRPINRAGDR